MGRRVDIPDLAFAGFLLALGGLAFHLAGELQIGRAGEMGPGYVPRGLALTSAAVVLCSGFAAADVRLRENLVLAVGLSAFAVALFIIGLRLPLRTWPW